MRLEPIGLKSELKNVSLSYAQLKNLKIELENGVSFYVTIKNRNKVQDTIIQEIIMRLLNQDIESVTTEVLDSIRNLSYNAEILFHSIYGK